MMMGVWLGDEFRRQFPCRLYRQLLEPNGQAGVFSVVAAIAAIAGAAIFACHWPLRGTLRE